MCEELLEPLQDHWGRLTIRSAFRGREVNALGNAKGYNCASTEKNAAGHIWDMLDANGHKGATACVVIPDFRDRHQQEGDWRILAEWIDANLPYATLEFFPDFVGVQHPVARTATAADR